MRVSTARFPLQVAVVYLLLGGGYILLSDLLVEHLAGDAVQATHVQTAKGWGFVLVTALVLFLLLRNKWRLLQAEITARREAEQALQRLNSELEARIARRTAELAAAKEAAESADRLKSAFLATMSHELRTPLNSIIGFTGVLLQGLAGPVNEEQHKQLTIIQASGRHLLALINDVLDISRIEAGQMQLDLSTFDVGEALERVVRMVAPLAEHKGLALHWQRPAAPIRVTTDQRRLEQVFVNLLNNAVKFTEQGSVRIDCAGAGRLHGHRHRHPGRTARPPGHPLLPDGQHAAPPVRGNGAGAVHLPAAARPDGRRARGGLHPGRGQRVHRDPAANTRRSDMSDRLLVIEDNEQNLYLMRFLLEKNGFTVLGVTDGARAVAVALEWRPRAILLDIQLPGMDGYAVAAALKEQAELAAVPIIAVTSHAMAGDRQRILAAGAGGYIEKPIDPTTFVEEIRRHLAG